MNQPSYKIMFNGELMPDVALDTVKENLARLFKSDSARINALFTGAAVTLKRDLAEHEADQYLEALQKAGARVRKELDLSADLSLMPTDEQADKPQANGSATPVAAAPQSAASPYAPPQADMAENLPPFGEIKILSLNGRIGRARYLGWGTAMLLCSIPILTLEEGLRAFSSTLSMSVLFLAMLTAIVFGVCLSVQRLHDMGWSGWLWLLAFVPFFGGLFSLLLLVIPGTQGANRYGPPPPPNSTSVKILACLFPLVFIIGLLTAIALPQYQSYVERAHSSNNGAR